MAEFKVGDKVRLKTNSYKGMKGAEAFQPGAVGTITRVAQDPNPTGADIEVDGEILYFFGSEYEALEYDQRTVDDIVKYMRESMWYGAAAAVEKEFAEPKMRTVTVNLQVPKGESVVDYLGSIGIDYDIEGGN